MVTIPPFPSQDLAKLVLGYLAEEQLMTAYDEFLQASPYLDAYHNEFDRIFMTSLKKILAEYRAVKIYVESCKPYSLRKRLFGCSNLLEAVIFLIDNVDVSKLSPQQPSRTSLDIRNASDRSSLCAVCASLKLNKCVCRTRQSCHDRLTQSSQHLGESTPASSVETTSLKDLPGNNVNTKKKQLKTLPRDSALSESTSYGFIDSNNAETSVVCVNTLPNTASSQNRNQSTIEVENYNVINPPVQRIEEENILTHHLPSNRVSVAGTFQDFSEGVRGNEITNQNVPDSSTSENTSMQVSCQGLSTPVLEKNTKNAKTLSKAHIYLTVGTVKNKPVRMVPTVDGSSTDSQTSVTRAGEQKVTILSDIKVDNSVTSDKAKMPPVLKNATSTPLMQMQTILINGTPAYKQQLPHSYTKDEIMAMPTIIVVPKSAAPQIPLPHQSQTQTTSTITSSVHSFTPLVIDVPPDTIEKPNTDTVSNMPILNPPQESDNGLLVKAAENKNVSVPKDHTDTGVRNTPQVLPPTRKSSSTPRRTSHVRVLDFTTPRRILSEHIAESTAENADSPAEVIVSRSPNLHTFASSVSVDNDNTIVNDPKIDQNNLNNTDSSKEKDSAVKVIPCKKARNWDAELRALAVPNRMADMENIESCITTCKPRSKKAKKTPAAAKNNNDTSNGPNKTQPKKTSKTKTVKKKTEEPIEEPIVIEDSNNVPVKPTINLITSSEWNPQEPNKSQNKSNTGELADTPEMDRVSLQNAMGAKLNISEFLETPYKQAIYDIQMDTPKFLGPDLPDDEPLSSIKILSMPTPMLLQTPKPAFATPSSYSSRPTDYSSGGSYYKPDDQDYLPVDLEFPSKASKDKALIEVGKAPDEEKHIKQKSSDFKSSRPVRKCTKNVSYRDLISNKTRDCSEKQEETSSCSESMNDSIENKNERIVKDAKPKKIKPDPKKKNPTKSSSKKRKTPVKKDSQKSFLKIKPRRVTPIKVSMSGKIKKRTPERPGKSSVTSKEHKGMEPPAVVSAPTKSRRKSSTPRKIHCTKTFNSESSGHESPEITPKHTQNVVKDSVMQDAVVQDSDSENVPLRWSDDGSQDGKLKDSQENDSEDISKIKEYIASEIQNVPKSVASNEITGNFQVDLISRGFDIETAKIIERDLLDPPSVTNASCESKLTLTDTMSKDDEVPLEKTAESDTSCNLKIDQEEENDEEIEFSVSECTEESENYITCHHDETSDTKPAENVKLKDKFCMEVCIDEDVTVRLRATSLNTMFELDTNEQQNQETDEPQYDQLETELAVNSISNMERLYTPMKDAMRAQVYEIFDSTLTSIDTPLKADSPRRKECDTTVTEIVLEVEKVEEKEKPETKKRKRIDSADSVESTIETKRPKPEAQLFGSMSTAKIQSFDIESVLCKLHGP